MPPKQSKADVAKKQKVVEDKTFGLKNKNKSKSVQKYVQNIQSSAQPKPDPTKLAAKCQKGFKCKFSHDLNIQRKGEKIDIYSDKRDEEDTMEDWDQETLEKVVESKKNEYNQNRPTEIVCYFFLQNLFFANDVDEALDLDVGKRKCLCGNSFACTIELNQVKLDSDGCFLAFYDGGFSRTWYLNLFTFSLLNVQVCKHFLEAVEKKQYGWFWACPNGGKECHYRHALPPGYILKSQMKALLDAESEKMLIEDEIEDKRAKLTTTTPMTPDLFVQWKKKKIDEREAGLAEQRAERAKNDRMSGRELFLSDASLFVDDAEAYEKYQREEESESTEQKVKDESSAAAAGPSSSANAVADSEEILLDDDDDDELDMDELNELEASLSRTSIQIREPGIEASS
ncbi:hypothetical protein EZV62_025499 [Acer yangbiense]|uniref:C3H1-type domain-containing protein n=1 Tax=Acer yangbiense TaxID=1000413 RepID=A0A5C7GXZ6_9ROSI|nr:hypothetical protein EZV62_025499 [Acer yangbiense]